MIQEFNSLNYITAKFTSEELAIALAKITHVLAFSKRKKKQEKIMVIENAHDALRLSAICNNLQLQVNGVPRIQASFNTAQIFIKIMVGTNVEWLSRSIRRWTDYYIEHNKLLVLSQGKHRKVISLIDDEDIKAECLAWARMSKPSKRTGENLRAFARDHLDLSINVSTANKWFDVLGFPITDSDQRQSSIYIDGHEKPDVQEYRLGFCRRFNENYLPRMKQYDGDQLNVVYPLLKEGQCEIVPLYHDESTFHSNEGQRYVRVERGTTIIKQKSRGRGLMVSDYVCACHGQMVDPDTDVPTRVTIIYGANNQDGYWTGDNVAKQTRDIFPVFEKLHPGCIPLFIFDNSSGHHKRAPDCRNVNALNLSDGGKNCPLMRDGFYFENGVHTVHTMTNAKGEQKGLRTILTERGLWTPGLKKNEAKAILLAQDDFCKGQLKSALEEVILSLGGMMDFVPRYHPEFNPIENVWGWAKRMVRNNCDYTFESLKTNVPEALDSVPLAYIQRVFRMAFRLMDV